VRFVALTVAGLLVPLSAFSGQQPVSPLRAAIQREARRHAADLVVTTATATPTRALAAAAAQAQGADGWDAVLQLQPGTRVRVVARQGRSVRGTVVVVSESGLSTDQGAFLRDEIVRIYRARAPQRLSVAAYTGIGALAGAVTGYVAGATSYDCRGCGEQRLATVMGTIGGVFLGGMGGYIIGEVVHHRREEVVYSGR